MTSIKYRVGFIVEGEGEKIAYNSLFTRSVPDESRPGYIPTINAGSCSSVIRRLSEHLTDMSKAYDIKSIVVSVDLKDVIDQKLVVDKEDLICKITEEFKQWKVKALLDGRCVYIPDSIFVIPQIKKFESWLISDLEGLFHSGYTKTLIPEFSDTEVVSSPDSWLAKNVTLPGKVKKPAVVRKLVSAIRPEMMKLRNQSFADFFKLCNALVK